MKKGDNVIVITGKSKGHKGVILSLSGDRVVVSGAQKVKKHIKPKTRNEKGSVVEKESSLHISNVQLVDPKSGKQTRIHIKSEQGKKVRIAQKSGQVVK